MWKDSVRRALRLVTEQTGAIRQQMKQTENPDRLRQLGDQLASTVEIVTILNELLQYSDRKGDEDGDD